MFYAMTPSALRQAIAFPVRPSLVESCLTPEEAVDRIFLGAWRDSLDSIPLHRRGGALSGVTGHVAESVVELVLTDLGYHAIWHFAGPGRHGVDLLFLAPEGDRVLAVEVKGTLRAGRWPRISQRKAAQMSAAWVDKADNPGMANWDLESDDVYAAIVAVNFADMAYRVAMTSNFAKFQPVLSIEQLNGLDWLE
jgi:hypothetical protein